MTDEEYQANLARVRERASNARNALPNGTAIVWVWLALLLLLIPLWH